MMMMMTLLSLKIITNRRQNSGAKRSGIGIRNGSGVFSLSLKIHFTTIERVERSLEEYTT